MINQEKQISPDKSLNLSKADSVKLAWENLPAAIKNKSGNQGHHHGHFGPHHGNHQYK